MRKRKILLIAVAFIILLSSVGCDNLTEKDVSGENDTYVAAGYKYSLTPSKRLSAYIDRYEKTGESSSLAMVAALALDELCYPVIQEYGKYLFSFAKSDISSELSNSFSRIYPNEDASEFINMYESLMSIYVLTYFFNMSDMKPVIYSERPDEIYGVLTTYLSSVFTDFWSATDLFYMAKYFPESEQLIKRVCGALNMLALTTEDDEVRYNAHMALSGIYNETSEKELYNFYLMLTAFKNTNEDVFVKNPDENGVLIQYNDLSQIAAAINEITLSERFSYDELNSFFGVPPCEVVGEEYVMMNYYTDSYIITFWGSPVHGVSVTDIASGEAVFDKIQSPKSDGSGLVWETA